MDLYERLFVRAQAAPVLCPRTLALWRPGVPQAGTYCRPAYSGSIPCTGPVRCTLCGQEVKP